MTRRPNDQMIRWPYWPDDHIDKMTRWPDDYMAILTKWPYWPDDQMTRWSDDQMTKWQYNHVDQMKRWRDKHIGRMTRWLDDLMTRWIYCPDDHIDQMTRWPDDQMTKIQWWYMKIWPYWCIATSSKTIVTLYRQKVSPEPPKLGHHLPYQIHWWCMINVTPCLPITVTNCSPTHLQFLQK